MNLRLVCKDLFCRVIFKDLFYFPIFQVDTTCLNEKPVTMQCYMSVWSLTSHLHHRRPNYQLELRLK